MFNFLASATGLLLGTLLVGGFIAAMLWIGFGFGGVVGWAIVIAMVYGALDG